MSLINISNLSFAYDGSYDNVFENVSFQIDTNWRLGLIGRNGRGKTTLFKLLIGQYEYTGKIASGVKFLYFPFDVSDKTVLTLEVVQAINAGFEQWQLERELALLDIEDDVLHRPFETLSNGEQTKVLLAALFLEDSGYLLIDEPTNHLDLAARQTVSAYLKSKKNFILVSHDRTFLDHCADHILSINKTNIEVQRGNFSTWWENKAQQDSYERAENEKLNKEIARLKTASERNANWSDNVEKTKYGTKNSGLRPDRGFIGAKSAKMMKRSKSVEQRTQTAIAEKSQLLRNIEDAGDLKITPLSYHANRLLMLDDLSIFYGEKEACHKVSFEIERGQRVALCGKNGSGKSSIIKLICGAELTYKGNFHKGSKLKLSYVSQDTSHLQGDLSDFAKQKGIDESLFKAILRKLDFSRVQFEKDIAHFSGGQKKKVLIAASLCEQAHLYIWDEPLNFIDVLSRIQIENLLLQYQPTMLFVEHDQAFTNQIATKQVILRG